MGEGKRSVSSSLGGILCNTKTLTELLHTTAPANTSLKQRAVHQIIKRKPQYIFHPFASRLTALGLKNECIQKNVQIHRQFVTDIEAETYLFSLHNETLVYECIC